MSRRRNKRNTKELVLLAILALAYLYIGFETYAGNDPTPIPSPSPIPTEYPYPTPTPTASPNPTSTPFPTPAPSGGALPIETSLWLSISDFSTAPQEVTQFISEGKFDFVVLTCAKMDAANTITLNSGTQEAVNYIRSNNPSVDVYCDLYSFDSNSPHGGSHDRAIEDGLNIPDYSTESLRQKAVSSVVSFWNQYSYLFNALIDDTEQYYGEPWDQRSYFALAESAISPALYFPWVYFGATSYVQTQRLAVGLYGSHCYYESEWKSALDRVQQDSTGKIGYQIWLMAETYANYPTITQQLQFFNEQISLHGWSYYSRLKSVGMWHYKSMSTEDKNAWISWINSFNSPSTDGYANLALIPDCWYEENQQITFLDYSMVHTPGQPSIRIERHIDGLDSNWVRECDGYWYRVKGGDELVTSIWIYMSDSAQGSESTSWFGGKLGVDFYGYGLISEADRIKYGLPSTKIWSILDAYPHSGAEHIASTVRWGTNTWTRKSLADIGLTHVPTTYYDGSPLDHIWTKISPPGEESRWAFIPLVEPTVITSMVLTIQVGPFEDAGLGWFADAELYIIPS